MTLFKDYPSYTEINIDLCAIHAFQMVCSLFDVKHEKYTLRIKLKYDEKHVIFKK